MDTSAATAKEQLHDWPAWFCRLRSICPRQQTTLNPPQPRADLGKQICATARRRPILGLVSPCFACSISLAYQVTDIVVASSVKPNGIISPPKSFWPEEAFSKFMPTNTVVERAVPHNLEAERPLLGSIILDNGALNLVVGTVGRDDFFSESHRTIFSKMLEL